MDKYVFRNKLTRKRNWTSSSQDEYATNMESPQLNTNFGTYIAERRRDIRDYSRETNESWIRTSKFSYIRIPFDQYWSRSNKKWMNELFIRSFKGYDTQLNTIYRLPESSNNRGNLNTFVDTRTADMEFSSESQNLLVASNFQKGGYLSIFSMSSLFKEKSIVHPTYNEELARPTTCSFTSPILTAQWIRSGSAIVICNRSSREISLYDVTKLELSQLTTVPSFVDSIIPYHFANPSLYIVSQVNGTIQMIDSRQQEKALIIWDNTFGVKRSLTSLMVSQEKENELICTYKTPCTIDIFDLRNTQYSAITGKRSPRHIVSSPVSCQMSCHPISLHSFFTMDEVIATLSNGSVTLINKYTGSTRLSTDEHVLGHVYENDGEVLRQSRSSVLTASLYCPSAMTNSSAINIYDFDNLQSEKKKGNQLVPSLLTIQCDKPVHGICYSPEWECFISACGDVAEDHSLVVYRI